MATHNMTSVQARRIAHELLSQHGLMGQGWKFHFTTARSYLGATHFPSKTVRVSNVWLANMDEADFRNTLLHEIAHCLAGADAGHGEKWRSVALSLGCDAKVTGHVSEAIDSSEVWVGVCPTCGVIVRQNVAPQSVESCGECSEDFSPHHVFKWEHNGSKPIMNEAYLSDLDGMRFEYGLTG